MLRFEIVWLRQTAGVARDPTKMKMVRFKREACAHAKQDYKAAKPPFCQGGNGDASP